MMKKGIALVTALLILTNLNSANAGSEIHLKSRRFTPAKGISDTTKAKIEAIPKRAHILLQLDHIPTIEERKQLKSRGVKLLSYVPNKSWFASIPSNKATEIAALPNVRAISEILPGDKIASAIKEKGVNDYSTNEKGEAKLVVMFFDDVSLNEASSIISNYNGTITGAAPIINALVVYLPKDKIYELASEDSVQWIDQHYKPTVDNDGIRAAIGVDTVQQAPYNLTGTGVVIGQWDGGCVDGGHDDLAGRVIQRNCTGPYGDHATHVAGTILGDGTRSSIVGQAPGSDCSTCDGILWAAERTPSDVNVVFYGMLRQKGDPVPPPNGQEFTLAQELSCFWKRGDLTKNTWYVTWGTYTLELIYTDEEGSHKIYFYDKSSCDVSLNNDYSSRGGNAVIFWEWVKGTPYQWKGMAPDANVISYLWWDDVTDMTSDYNEAINTYGIDLSTNSWGTGHGGDYDLASEAYDKIIRGNITRPISIIGSAGNEGPGWNTVRIPNSAKNTIEVGATNSDDDSLYFNPSTGKGSSLGPTDDGRIKPDIVAPGDEVAGDMGIVSTVPGNAYGVMQGTSMATPAVAGSVALMLEDWRDTHTTEPNLLPSTIKAILIQTAKDLGNTGPDFRYGYGRIDVYEAIKLIERDNINNDIVLEDSITDQNDKDSFTVDVPDGQLARLKITLVWDDYPGDPAAAEALVNDLDLIVKDPTGTRHYPWTLDKDDPGAAAEVNRPDHLNNVEQVYVDNPISGTWTIDINGFNVPEPVQNYSLVSNLILVFPGYFVVDDFNSYADATDLETVWTSDVSSEIYLVDGADKAMEIRYYYDHSYDEAGRTPVEPNWTRENVEVLSLSFKGEPNNSAVEMYVRLGDGSTTAEVNYPGDPNDFKLDQWQKCNIKLQDFAGVDMNNVTNITIGFRGGSDTDTLGYPTILLDDIRLYRLKCARDPHCWNCLTQCHSDVDCDGYVGLGDFQVFKEAFAGEYNPCADFNRDGDITLKDFQIFNENFGTSPDPNCDCGAPWPPEQGRGAGSQQQEISESELEDMIKWIIEHDLPGWEEFILRLYDE